MTENNLERAQREEALYDSEQFAGEYESHWSRFGHAQGPGYYKDYYASLIRDVLTENAKGKTVLELGATYWFSCLDLDNFHPASLTCINISQRELEKGRALYQSVCNGAAEFKLMDAHRLEFADESFDIVYGGGILHHLDFEVAAREVFRVLKPGGTCVFIEPLAANPIGKLVRRLTPNVRTSDERPLGKAELAILDRYFKTDYRFMQLFYVPAGVLSAKLFKTPYNRLMKAAFNVDKFLERHSPLWFKMLFRHLHIVGKKD